MVKNIYRNGIFGLLIGTLILGILSTTEVFTQIGEPFAGFYAYRNHAWNVWWVGAPNPPWWLEQLPVQVQDELLSIEGQPFDHNVREVYQAAAAAGQETVEIVVRREGETLSLTLPLETFTLGRFFDIKLPDIISGLGFWLLGWVVYRARPQDQVNRIFAVFASVSAAALWLSLPTIFPEADILARLNTAGWVIGSAFVGASAIHLTLLFPTKIRRLEVSWLIWLYIFMGLVSGALVASMGMRWQALEAAWIEPVSGISNIIIIATLGLGVFLFLFRLIWLLAARRDSRRLRRQVLFLLAGVLFALPYIFIVVIRVLSRSNATYFAVGLDLRYLMLMVPLAFAFVILRYQTFRSPHPILIGVFILASSAVVANLGAWALRQVEPAWVNTLNWTPFVLIFGASFLAALFWSSQTSWYGTFSRLFEWDRRSFAAVQQVTQQTLRAINLGRLPDVICDALVQHMELERAFLWLWDESAENYELVGTSGARGADHPIPERLTPPLATLQTRSIRLLAEGIPVPAWLSNLEQIGSVEVITPLNLQDRRVGLLGLGKRWDDEIFDRRDISIVELIGQQSALFLLVGMQVEQLRQVPGQIANAQESERFKIAQELHDTVQQFLGSLPFYLDTSRTNIRDNPAEAEALLNRILPEVEAAAQTVRQIRNNLAPLQLARGLNQPLETLVEHFRFRTGLQAKTHLTLETDTLLPPGARHALYRVVQQALDNAAAHAEATCIELAITLADNKLHFCVEDDGKGFTPEQQAAAVERGSFGLTSMQARITAVGGDFKIDSTPGEGTKINGWLPTS